MDITVGHRDFKTQLLEIRVSGYFCSPRILLNSVSVKRNNGEYSVLNDVGNEVIVQLNSNIFNRLPQLLIESEEIKIFGNPGWTQFAGWKKTWLVQWLAATLHAMQMLSRAKKLNKTS